MLTCSLLEAMKIWAEFSDALQGHNGFGGTVAEIYSYRLQQYSPTKTLEVYRGAARSLVMLLNEFCREYNCTAVVDGWNPDKWMDEVGTPGHFDHRCHIEILTERTRK